MGPVDTGDGDRALGVRLAARPVDGAANEALGEFIARAVGAPKSAVILLAGHTARTKRLLISGDWADLAPKLAALVNEKG